MGVTVKKTLLGGIVVSYDCPKCKERLRSKASEVGSPDSCPECGQAFRVPGKRELAEFLETDAEKKAASAKQRQELKEGMLRAAGTVRQGADSIRKKAVNALEERRQRQEENRLREEERARERLAALRAVPEGVVMLEGTSSFGLEVVGESRRQHNFIKLFGPPQEDGVMEVVTACLVLDDTNPHDKNAVQVLVQRLPVGFLSRTDAVRFRKFIQRPEWQGQTAFCCRASVRGGWQSRTDPNDKGMFGIWLDVAME